MNSCFEAVPLPLVRPPTTTTANAHSTGTDLMPCMAESPVHSPGWRPGGGGAAPCCAAPPVLATWAYTPLARSSRPGAHRLRPAPPFSPASSEQARPSVCRVRFSRPSFACSRLPSVPSSACCARRGQRVSSVCPPPARPVPRLSTPRTRTHVSPISSALSHARSKPHRPLFIFVAAAVGWASGAPAPAPVQSAWICR